MIFLNLKDIKAKYLKFLKQKIKKKNKNKNKQIQRNFNVCPKTKFLLFPNQKNNLTNMQIFKKI